MQAAKDSFYVALRERLARWNPQRTVVVDGVSRPAIVAAENERPAVERAGNVYYIEWGEEQAMSYNGGQQVSMACAISYFTNGTGDAGEDRGRALGTLDADLLAICSPASAELNDYSSGEVVFLGSHVVWTAPKLRVAKTGSRQVGHEATMTLFFQREVPA